MRQITKIEAADDNSQKRSEQSIKCPDLAGAAAISTSRRLRLSSCSSGESVRSTGDVAHCLRRIGAVRGTHDRTVTGVQKPLCRGIAGRRVFAVQSAP